MSTCLSPHPLLISPSILSADFSDLGKDLTKAEAAGADWHHVDVMDGHFVPNLTIGPPVVRSVFKSASIPLDVHLMIEDPWRFADAFLDAGAAVLTVHAEILERGDAKALFKHIRTHGAQAAVALNPDTDPDRITQYLDDLDMVLCMSVFPGFAGQSFISDVLAKVRSLREDHGYKGRIQMDGGITRENVAACAAAGCDVFVAGSALYGAEDFAAETQVFRAQLAQALAGGAGL